MGKYFGIYKTSLKESLAYKFDFLVLTIITPIGLLIFYFLWASIFSYNEVDVIKGYTLTQMISYYVLTTIVLTLSWSSADRRIERGVLSGKILFRFLEPHTLLQRDICQNLAQRTVALFIIIIPVLIIGFVFFGVESASRTLVVLFIVCIIFAMIFRYLITYLIGLLAFWFQNISGIRSAKDPVIMILAGAFLPLSFFPQWFISISNVLPFRFLVDLPVNIYLGNYAVNEIFVQFGIGIIWIIGLIIFVIWAENRAKKKFTGVGF